MQRFSLYLILLISLFGATAAVQQPQPASEMQSLAKAFAGTWSIDEQHEPSESRPQGRHGHATQIWRRGPGGFTFMEEFRDDSPAGEFGLALYISLVESGRREPSLTLLKNLAAALHIPVAMLFMWQGEPKLGVQARVVDRLREMLLELDRIIVEANE